MASDTGPVEDVDAPEVAVGERLFLETRFAQFFAANSHGDANAALSAGDPTVDISVTITAPLSGPFAGMAMNCRSCHLVDEQKGVRGGGNRTYADFARRSPVPPRSDEKLTTPRNSPPLVNASLARRDFLQHFDGEFPSPEALTRATFTGRNFGWLPAEYKHAVAHIAHIIRDDDGLGELAQSAGGPYRVVLDGKDAAIPPELRLPSRFRIDVARASDEDILDAIGRLVAAYPRSLEFSRADDGAFNGSPYDVFLRKNGLPTAPGPGESDLAYSRRLRTALLALPRPHYVTSKAGHFVLHKQPFRFGPRELKGLQVFLSESTAGATALVKGVGNCVACHPAPLFTDFRFHNTGAAQEEYDAIHGAGAFAALAIPDLRTRQADFDAFLPPTRRHPQALGPFLSVPMSARPGATDLGVWNTFANPDVSDPQERLRGALCDAQPKTTCTLPALLDKAIARFKTPGLRDLGHSAPYLHTGRFDLVEDVVRLYVRFSALARAGAMRNPDPALLGIALKPDDIAALSAFLAALNEDYE